MKLPLRRTMTLALVGGAAYAGWTWWARREPAVEAAPPEWPPIDRPGTAPSANGDPPNAAASADLSPPHAPTPSATADAARTPTADTPSTDGSIPEGTAQPLAGSAGSGGDRAWTEPGDDGSCPVGFPIKANDNSGIYHVPGGRFYDRTNPERCYRDEESATADGYRRAKS